MHLGWGWGRGVHGMIIGYATQTLATIVLAPWRSYVEINYWTRRPWQHVLLFLQSNPTTKYGSFATNISVLVSGKALEFAREFEENLDNAWFRKYATPEATHPNAPDLHLVTTTVVSLVLCNYSEYDRRILQQCLGFPLSLLNLCPEVVPDLRRSTASRLSGMARRDLDATSAKFRDNHKAEIDRVAADGSYPVCLGASLAALRHMLLADTQEVESSNKIVVKQSERAPNVDCELLAARLTNVKAVYTEVGESPSSKDLLAMAHSFQGHWTSKESYNLLGDRQRFALPPHMVDSHAAIDDEPTKSAAPEPAPVPALCDAASQATMDELIAEQMPLVWSAPFNLCWSRAWVK